MIFNPAPMEVGFAYGDIIDTHALPLTGYGEVDHYKITWTYYLQ